MYEGEQLMRIGEIAAFYGVSAKALRIYEKMGILMPVRVDEHTGYRYYSADQVRQLDALLELRRLGFSLAEIRDLLRGEIDRNEYMEALVHKKAMWQDKISEAQDRIDDIDRVIEALATSRPPTKLHELTEEERAHLMSRLVCVDKLHGRNEISEAIWL